MTSINNQRHKIMRYYNMVKQKPHLAILWGGCSDEVVCEQGYKYICMYTVSVWTHNKCTSHYNEHSLTSIPGNSMYRHLPTAMPSVHIIIVYKHILVCIYID